MRQIIGIPVLIFLLLKVAGHCLIALLSEKKIALYESKYAGEARKPIKHRSLTINNRALPDFDSWLHYLKGNFNLVGPAPILQSKAITLGSRIGSRLSVAPGLIHPYSLKLRAGIAHQDELETSAYFAEQSSDVRRMQLIGTFLMQRLFGHQPKNVEHSRRFNLFGVTLHAVKMKEAVNQVVESLRDGSASKRKFAFVNADCANQYFKNKAYKKTLTKFDAVFPDGVGVRIAANWLGSQIPNNVNGTDMFPLLCEELQTQGRSIYLLGAKPEVVEKLAGLMALRYPNLKIAGYHDGYSMQHDPDQLLAKINASAPDLLLVAMGAPQQEHWINTHMPDLNVKAAMGVGGLFDFYSGHVSRAPEFLREMSLEWVWRLAVQPLDKGSRYLIGNPLFLYRVMKTAWQKTPSQVLSSHSKSQYQIY